MGLLLFIFSMKAGAEDGQGQGMKAVFGEDSFRFLYISEAWGQEIGSLDVHMGAMGTSSKGDLVNLGILAKRQDFNSPLKILIGTQIYYSNVDNANAVALALGGEVLIRPEKFSGIGFGFTYYIAPKATSFSDAAGFNEYNASINYLLTSKSVLSFGYQFISVKLNTDGNTRKLEDGYFIGLDLRF